MFLYYHKRRNNEVFTLGAYDWVKINDIDNYKKSTIKRGQEVKWELSLTHSYRVIGKKSRDVKGYQLVLIPA